MKKYKKTLIVFFDFLIIFLLSFSLFNCGGGGGSSTPYVLPAPHFNTIPDNIYTSIYTISWTNIGDSVSYIVEEADDTSFISANQVYNGSDTYVNLTGKLDGIYYFRIKSTVNGTESSWTVSHKINVKVYNKYQKLLGSSYDDGAYDILALPDSSFVIAGYSKGGGNGTLPQYGNTDIYVMKINSYGEIIWHKTYGGNYDDIVYSIVRAYDGGFVLTGSSNSTNITGAVNNGASDYFIMKLDSFGDSVWIKMIGGSDMDDAKKIIRSNDGEYIICGTSKSSNISGVNYGNALSTNGLLVKIGEDGVIDWLKVYGGSLPDFLTGISAVSDSSGYYLCGYTYSTDLPTETDPQFYDYYVLRINNNGDTVWEKVFGGGNFDYARSVLSVENGLIITGNSNSDDIPGITTDINISANSVYTIKLSDTGSIIWQIRTGGTNDDYAYNIFQDTGNNIYLTGYTESTGFSDITNAGSVDGYIIKLDDSNGTVVWQKSFGGSDRDYIYAGQHTQDAGFVFVGVSESGTSIDSNAHGLRDIYLIKTDSSGNSN